MSSSRVRLPGSNRDPLPGARAIRDADPNERFEVTVIVRTSSSSQLSNHVKETNVRAHRERRYLSRKEFETTHGGSRQDLQKVDDFARKHGLEVKEVNAAARSVKLYGTVGAYSSAFDVKLEQYEHPKGAYRGRKGELTIPKDLDGVVKSVHGLDNRRQVEPRFHRFSFAKHLEAMFMRPRFSTTDLAGLYNFPTNLNGRGQCVAIVEFGGGYTTNDLNTYFGNLGIQMPNVSNVSVDSGQNSPGLFPIDDPRNADGEVELDVEVVGGIAPGANIVVYFAPNSDQGFIDAINTAIHDSQNNPSILSISWGGPESTWTAQTMQTLDQAFQDAAALGVTVFAASGDNGSSDGGAGENPVHEHVDYPASDPHVVGCGGTSLTASGGSITGETCWSGSGGGVSEIYGLPDYQARANVPPSPVTKKAGRGVPDICADADPNTGYNIVVDGQSIQIGGTSAVAPLWAGLTALINQSLKAHVGSLNHLLYSAPANAFHDITQGNNDSVGNGNFQAGPGWDACTGLGSPDGSNLLSFLAGTPATMKKTGKTT
jgi:kumamolisin